MADTQGLTRLPDWQARLTTYLAQTAAVPFQLGAMDCALFAAGAVTAMTGVDMAAPHRGRYATAIGGARVLRKAGFADVADLAAAHLPEVPPSLAQPGDVAAVREGDHLALGIVQGRAIYVRGVAGLCTVPRSRALRAWRV